MERLLGKDVQDVAVKLFQIDAVKFGEFKLTFGGLSPFYIDLRETGTHISLFKAVGHLVAALPVFTQARHDKLAVCGVPMSALPLATFIACEKNLPFLLCRKEPKNHGTGKQIEGSLETGTNVVIVDDIASSGGSILETAAYLRANDFVVTDAVVFLDRESGGKEVLEKQGIKLHHVLGVSDLCRVLVNAGLLHEDQFDKIRHFVQEMRVEAANGTAKLQQE